MFNQFFTYERVEPTRSVKGLLIWTASRPVSQFQNASLVYVITKDTLHCCDFLDPSEFHDAVDRIADGEDPGEVLPGKSLYIPFEDLVRVEKAPRDSWVSVRFHGEKGLTSRRFACPDDLGDTLFRELRQRLAPRLRYGKERVTIMHAAVIPLSMLIVVVLVAGFLLLGSLAGADAQNTGTKSARGAAILGQLLGPIGVVILGAIASLGVCCWMVVAVILRPMQKVLDDPAGQSESAREKRAGGRRAGSGELAEPSKVPFYTAIGSLAVSVPAFGCNCLPWGSIGGFLLGAVGLLGAAVAGVLAMNRRVSGLGLAITGAVVNLIAVLVAFVLTIVTIVHAVGPAQGGASYSGGQTVAGWGTFTDPDGDCRCNKVGDALILKVPAGSHDLKASTLNAPRVLQDVRGDFRIDVKVIASQGDAVGSYQAPGLLVWNNRDYLRLERVRNTSGALSVTLELHVGGSMANQQIASLPDKDTWLRLQRRGGYLLAFYRIEGELWTPLRPVEIAMPDKVSAGVAAVNVGRPLEARFEELSLESK
jgi:regulation of enolase protein 1 (concanavalin A-like superfamily)